MKKEAAVNTFDGGLVLDLNPLLQESTTLTNCLNGTLITYNGNENALLNDMGNGRVETAFLPEGYIPLGTCSLGGIIYIASYNPLLKKCQLGSFPSPERNFTSEDLLTKADSNSSLKVESFFTGENISKTLQIIELLPPDKYIYPGDKFLVYFKNVFRSDESLFLSAFGSEDKNIDDLPKYLKLYLVTVSDSGDIKYIDNLVWKDFNGKGDYYISPSIDDGKNGKVDLDAYRTLVSSGYNIYKESSSGKLAILAKLEVIDTLSVGYIVNKENVLDPFANVENVGGKLKVISAYMLYLSVNWTYYNGNKVGPSGIKIKSNTDAISFKGSSSPTLPGSSPRGGSYIKFYNGDNKKAIELNPMILSLYISEDGVHIYNLNNYSEQTATGLSYYLLDVNRAYTSVNRLNDGSDNPMWIKIPLKEGNPNNKLVKLEIIPAMEFGDYPLLKNTISFDLSKVGTGSTAITEYRYFIDEYQSILTYGLEIYDKMSNPITELNFNFYTLNTNNYSIITAVDNSAAQTAQNAGEEVPGGSQFDLDSDEFSNFDSKYNFTNKEYSFKVDRGLITSGVFTKSISFVDLPKDKCYIVEIEFKRGAEDSNKYFYRMMYTSPVFNLDYINNNCLDFKELTPTYKVSLYTEWKTTSKYINVTETKPENNLYGVTIESSETKEGLIYSKYNVFKPRYNDGDVVLTGVVLKHLNDIPDYNSEQIHVGEGTISELNPISVTWEDRTKAESLQGNKYIITYGLTSKIDIPYNLLGGNKPVPSTYTLEPIKVYEDFFYILVQLRKAGDGCYFLLITSDKMPSNDALFIGSSDTDKYLAILYFGPGNENNYITGPLSSLGPIYTQLDSLMDNWDVIPIIFACTTLNDSIHNCGWGVLSNRQEHGEIYIEKKCFLGYIMRNTSSMTSLSATSNRQMIDSKSKARDALNDLRTNLNKLYKISEVPQTIETTLNNNLTYWNNFDFKQVSTFTRLSELEVEFVIGDNDLTLSKVDLNLIKVNNLKLPLRYSALPPTFEIEEYIRTSELENLLENTSNKIIYAKKDSGGNYTRFTPSNASINLVPGEVYNIESSNAVNKKANLLTIAGQLQSKFLEDYHIYFGADDESYTLKATNNPF